MTLVLLVTVFSFSATPDTWFNQQKVVAEADLNSGAPARVRKAQQRFATMHATASTDANDDWIVYSAWRSACCSFRLGDYAEAERALEELIRAHPRHGLILLVHREVGEFYIANWKVEQAKSHFEAAIALAPKYSFRGQTRDLAPLEVTRIRMKYANCLVKAAANSEARKTLLILEQELTGILAAAYEQKQWNEDGEYLYAECQFSLSELDRRDQNTLASITRQKACLKRLTLFKTERSSQLQLTGHIHLSHNYSKLTRFLDGEAELKAGAELLKRYPNDSCSGDLENTQAQLRIDWVLCDFENDPQDPDLMKHLEIAEQSATKALADYGKTSAQRTIGAANSLNSLAMAEDLRGRILESAQKPAEARQAYENARKRADESLALFSEILPPNHDVLLDLRRNRAARFLRLGDTNAARNDTKLVLNALVERYGAQYMDCALCHQLLTEIELKSGNLKEAAIHAEAHRRLSNEHLLTYVTGLTASEQQTFFRRWNDPGLHSSLMLGVRDVALGERSAEWLLNGKAKTTEVLAYANRKARESAHFHELREAVERQAYILYGPETTDTEAQLLQEEKNKRNAAEKRAAEVPEQWYTLQALREQLADDEAYVDICCLREPGKTTRTYYAWVVTATHPTQVVRIGAAEPIDKLVQTLIERLEEFDRPGSPERENGIAMGEKRLREDCLRPLSELLFMPIHRAVGDKPRWIISPDGPLWNVAWASLILPGTDEYAVQKFTFRYTISGRDLLARNESREKSGRPLVIADPDYDFSSPGAVGSVRRGGFLPAVGNLPESRREGQEVKTSLTSSESIPILRIQAEATKDAVLGLALAPRVLYLSTHAFFLPSAAARVDDPFLCCGIAFAGFNFLPGGEKPEAFRLPGLLTGAEVLFANLHGTELVVLSSCQTGAGVTAYGHSAASLRHAFHLAGAKAVVSSLWSVEDKPAKDLMIDFMNEVSGSSAVDKATALRRAQLKMIDRLRKGGSSHTHPFLWAPFTLSGF